MAKITDSLVKVDDYGTAYIVDIEKVEEMEDRLIHLQNAFLIFGKIAPKEFQTALDMADELKHAKEL